MIEVTVKTLKNTSVKITIDENAPFDTQLQQFKEAGGIPDAPHIKLIHTGKVLDLTQTPVSYLIANGDAIIVMKSNPPKPVSTQSAVPAPTISENVTTVAPASSTVQSNTQQNNQTPAQQLPALPPVDTIWTEPLATDTTATYSTEQVHAIVPMIVSYIMQNPQLRLLMLSSPGLLSEIIIGSNFRNIVRQLLAQSNTLINSIRNGTPANIYIGVESGQSVQQNTQNMVPNTQNAQPNTQNMPTFPGNGTFTMEQLTQAMSMLGMTPQMLNFVENEYNAEYNTEYDDGYEDEEDSHEGHDHSHEGHDHSHNNSHNVQSTSSLSTQDQQNIAELMAITGAQFPVAKQAYESAGKNMEVAGSLLMQIMFN